MAGESKGKLDSLIDGLMDRGDPEDDRVPNIAEFEKAAEEEEKAEAEQEACCVFHGRGGGPDEPCGEASDAPSEGTEGGVAFLSIPAVKAGLKIAAQELGRYAINGLYVVADRIEATDGRMAIRIPSLAPEEPIPEANPLPGLVLRRDALKPLVAASKANGKLWVSPKWLEGAGMTVPMEKAAHDVSWPDFKEIYDREWKDTTTTVTLDPRRLKAICEALLYLQKGDGQEAVEITVSRATEDPVRIKAKGAEAILMPITIT